MNKWDRCCWFCGHIFAYWQPNLTVSSTKSSFSFCQTEANISGKSFWFSYSGSYNRRSTVLTPKPASQPAGHPSLAITYRAIRDTSLSLGFAHFSASSPRRTTGACRLMCCFTAAAKTRTDTIVSVAAPIWSTAEQILAKQITDRCRFVSISGSRYSRRSAKPDNYALIGPVNVILNKRHRIFTARLNLGAGLLPSAGAAEKNEVGSEFTSGPPGRKWVLERLIDCDHDFGVHEGAPRYQATCCIFGLPTSKHRW